MSKPHLMMTCIAMILAPPMLMVALSGKNMIEDRQSGRLLYFTQPG